MFPGLGLWPWLLSWVRATHQKWSSGWKINFMTAGAELFLSGSFFSPVFTLMLLFYSLLKCITSQWVNKNRHMMISLHSYLQTVPKSIAARPSRLLTVNSSLPCLYSCLSLPLLSRSTSFLYPVTKLLFLSYKWHYFSSVKKNPRQLNSRNKSQLLDISIPSLQKLTSATSLFLSLIKPCSNLNTEL